MLIFLDIDGVMVHANAWKHPEFLADGFAMFSHKAVNALKKIICNTDAGIVLTTSHKSRYTIQYWHNIFKARDIHVTHISRLPENVEMLNRKQELLNWFNVNNIDENFIIIDDDRSLNDLPEFLKERLVLTNSSIGLTDELANKALDLLSISTETPANPAKFV